MATSEGDPKIEGIRIWPDRTPDPLTDNPIVLTAPTPIPLSVFPTRVEWPLQMTNHWMAGAVSFLNVWSEKGYIEFDEPIDLDTLLTGGRVSGTFGFEGGTFEVFGDEDWVIHEDPGALGEACFNLPSELYALELEE